MSSVRLEIPHAHTQCISILEVPYELGFLSNNLGTSLGNHQDLPAQRAFFQDGGKFPWSANQSILSCTSSGHAGSHSVNTYLRFSMISRSPTLFRPTSNSTPLPTSAHVPEKGNHSRISYIERSTIYLEFCRFMSFAIPSSVVPHHRTPESKFLHSKPNYPDVEMEM